MTVLALLAGAMIARPALLLVPDLDAKTVTIQALVRLPKLGDAERLCIQVAWDALLEGSEEYTRTTLRAYGQQAGRTVVAAALADHLLLRLTLPKNQLATGFSMTESLLRRPLLNTEDLEAALKRRLAPPTDAWRAALDPEGWREAKPNRNEIVATFRRLVRPENLLIALGGDVEPAAAAREMARFDDWVPRNESGFVRSWASVAKPLMQSPGRVLTFELSGPESAGGLAAAPTQILAALALGVGKGSALQRVAREAHGWSYRQEGFLQPTPGGWRLRLILARQACEDPIQFLNELRNTVSADVKAWNQADRLRVVGMLKSWLECGIGVPPIRLLPEGRAVASLEERTHLRAWWRMKFGEELNEADLVRKAEAVKLDDLKAAALDELEKASARFLIGGS